MLQKDSSAPSIMGKFLGGWESVDLEPFCLLYPLALGDVHVRGEGQAVEDQMPGLVVADEGLYVHEIRCGVLNSDLFLQDSLRPSFGVFYVSQVVVWQKPALLLVNHLSILHQ